jgi:uncharacterized protein with GYD domain
MAEYVMLLKFTSKGIEHFKDAPNRFNAAKKTFESYGGKIKSFHVVLGRYDGVCIVEAPDDETIAKISLQIASLGNVKIETLRGFNEDLYTSMIQSMSK